MRNAKTVLPAIALAVAALGAATPGLTQKMLATYPTLQKGYMFDMATGTGHEVPFLAINGSSWQRRANTTATSSGRT